MKKEVSATSCILCTMQGLSKDIFHTTPTFSNVTACVLDRRIPVDVIELTQAKSVSYNWSLLLK